MAVSAKHKMFSNKLKNWCRGEGLDDAQALLTVVPEDTEITKVEDVLQTIKCLGVVRSLKGQALEVVKAVRLSDPDVTPEKC
uniref:Uncharacterized protein n=1 Tax=Salarias fasciatus TaxID=181472 RepID=A0A672G0Y1_SALFA